MPTTPTETSVANAAFTLLGERRISSLDDPNSKQAKLAKDRFPEIRDELLRMYPWTFATKRVGLAADAVAPVYKFSNAFTLPSDCIRLIEISNEGFFAYEVEDNKIVTDLDAPLNIKYTARIEDMSKADVLFRNALASGLALDLAESMTGTAAKVEQMAQLHRQRLSAARGSDGQEQSIRYDEESQWLDARYDGGNAWWRVPSGGGSPL